MKEHLIKIIKNSRSYSLAVAESMSETQYNSSMVDGSWNFEELMNHIAYGTQWFNDNYIKKIPTVWAPPTDKSSKKEIIKLIIEVYDDLFKTLERMVVDNETILGVWITLDHITHHRGQAVLYLRQNGVEPPEYVNVI